MNRLFFTLVPKKGSGCFFFLTPFFLPRIILIKKLGKAIDRMISW